MFSILLMQTMVLNLIHILKLYYFSLGKQTSIWRSLVGETRIILGKWAQSWESPSQATSWNLPKGVIRPFGPVWGRSKPTCRGSVLTGTSGGRLWTGPNGWKPVPKKYLPWGRYIFSCACLDHSMMWAHCCPCNWAAILWMAEPGCMPHWSWGIWMARRSAS